jgi:hypothetical protein
VKKGGKRIHVQKRLILGNLKEMFNKFTNDFQDVKIGFPDFVSSDPDI